MTSAGTVEREQMEICKRYGTTYVPADFDAKVGYAIATEGNVPVNGLRHLPTGDTTGWYIWLGETLSQEPDFFVPLHTRHLVERCPDVLKFLGLPPGYRFLVTGDYIDVWYDASLLDV